LAALLVVFWHSRLATMHAAHNYWPDGDAAFKAAHYPAFLNHLDVGVDVFFCISGYIMCLLVTRVTPSIYAAVNFMARRALRILPPYWFFTALVVAAFCLSRGKYNVGFLSGVWASDATRIVQSVFLIPQGQSPALGVGWTLVHEFLLYWLCALLILCGLNRRLPQVLVLMSLLALILLPLNISLLHGYLLSTYNIEFLFGALAFSWIKTASRIYPLLQLAAAILIYALVCKELDLGVDSAVLTGTLRPLGFGLVGFLLLSSFQGLDQRHSVLESRMGLLAARIGDASYTLYLSHWFVLSVMGKLLALAPKVSVVALIAWHCFSIVAAVTFAVWLAEHAELPLHKRLLVIWDKAMDRARVMRPDCPAQPSDAARASSAASTSN
jgi:exopolysaccharide production protein ExoZ